MFWISCELLEVKLIECFVLEPFKSIQENSLFCCVPIFLAKVTEWFENKALSPFPISLKMCLSF